MSQKTGRPPVLLVREWCQVKLNEGNSPENVSQGFKAVTQFLAFLNGKEATGHLITQHLQRKINAGQRPEKERAFLVAYYKWLYRSGYVERNITGDIDVKIPKGELKTEILAHADYLKIRDLIRKPYVKQAFIIGYWTGLRRKDVSELKWGAVDLDGLMIRIVPAKTQRRASKATIPILVGGELHALLCELQQSRTSEFVIDQVEDLCKKISTYVTEAYRKAGIKLDFHALRRTFITNALASGIGTETVMKMVGITSYDTIKHYAAVQEETIRAASDRLARYITQQEQLAPITTNQAG